MSEEKSKEPVDKESSKTEVHPPLPDVPLGAASAWSPPGHDNAEAPTASQSAQMKMAGEMESGRTPYDYSAELEKDQAAGAALSAGRGVSFSGIAAFAAIAALIAVSLVGWQIVNNVSQKIDSVNTSVERLADRLIVQGRIATKTGRAVVRAELQKSLRTLEQVIALGDPETKQEALKLQSEIRAVMALLGSGEKEPESLAEPARDAPAEPVSESQDSAGVTREPVSPFDIETPSFQISPVSPENLETEPSDEAVESSP